MDMVLGGILMIIVYIFIATYSNASKRKVLLDRLAYTLVVVVTTMLITVASFSVLTEKIMELPLGKWFYILISYIVGFLTPPLFSLLIFAIEAIFVSIFVRLLINFAFPPLKLPETPPLKTPQPATVPTQVAPISETVKSVRGETGVGEPEVGSVVGGEPKPNIVRMIHGGIEVATEIGGQLTGELGDSEKVPVVKELGTKGKIGEEVDVIVSTPETPEIETHEEPRETEEPERSPVYDLEFTVRTFDDVKRALMRKLMEMGYGMLDPANFILEGEENMRDGGKKYRVSYIDIQKGMTMYFECVVTRDGTLKIIDMKV